MPSSRVKKYAVPWKAFEPLREGAAGALELLAGFWAGLDTAA